MTAPSRNPVRTGETKRRKDARTWALPAAEHTRIRARLKMLRIARRLGLHDVTVCSPSSLSGYENRDASTLRLGDMCAMAATYGLTPREFFNYLFTDEDGLVERHEANRVLDTAMVYLRSLQPEDQELALDLLGTMCRSRGITVRVPPPEGDSRGHYNRNADRNTRARDAIRSLQAEQAAAEKIPTETSP